MSTHVTPGYTEDALLWDQESGTLSATQRPASHESRTFRVSWGVDRYLGLPEGLPAWAANRYIDAIQDLTNQLADHASMEHVPSDFYDTGDRYEITYTGGYKPYMDALNSLLDHVYGGDDASRWAHQSEAADELRATHGSKPSDDEVQARVRRIFTDRIRSLIVSGDASYTPAKPGNRYTAIRLDLDAGHLSAHTQPLTKADENVQVWQVSPLNYRQANRLMRRIGARALALANPTAPAAFAGDAREALEGILAAFLISAEQVTAHMDEHGIKDTPARREKALRALTAARFQK
ncbi:hypothetical protein [Nocardiopsis metallicus]|uniref:Uncharacterized protein n=1 Tax=Nocardiopsis metallicus TaxID=179819 RepID=A0A840WES1_9ACTN|nr:hypothetical protein [Nocardiopsis metallicus]MBB5491511.1 hypothetical protein [Nocardiopsis metallicus]